MFHAAFASLSGSNPHDGHECSRTHSCLSVFVPHDAHSLVVPRRLTATKCVPSRSHLYSSIRRNAPMRLQLDFESCPGVRPAPSRPSPRGCKVVFSGVVVRQLVEEVSALPFQVGVTLGNRLALFFPIVRAVFFPRQFPLGAFQPFALVGEVR